MTDFTTSSFKVILNPIPLLILIPLPFVAEPNLNIPISNENISTPSTMPPPSDEFDADEEEKPLKSDFFRVHMKKIELDDGTIKIMCNYCPKTYKAVKSFGYGTYWNHVKRNHPSELVKASNQGQISSVNIVGAFSDCELDVQLSQCVVAMKKKWIQYYKDIPNIYLLASCFDPRFKLEYLQDYLTHYYNSLGIETDVLSCCNSVETLLYELYDEYLKIYGPSLNISVSQPQLTSDGTTSSSQFKLKGLEDRLFSQRAKKLRASSSSSNTHSKLDRFLEANHVFLEDKFSIQGWWKDYEKEYPILAIIAKQILETPVSTVAVEQEFSAEPFGFTNRNRNRTEPSRSVLKNRNRNRTENRRFRNCPKPSYSGYGYGSAFPRNRNRRFETETEQKPNRGHHYIQGFNLTPN
ncbi:hypothetical protein Ddye_021478 [Dipteronia dyeriana]|uniref:BED-type domain-containing protein n=1 Tax=Dipteronia dyeriana TaxID=168575 RepID=A0AAD9U2G4_9ROSI|nr:hypothetical protein Ddye_021478 [Dipteronia dyeriana]